MTLRPRSTARFTQAFVAGSRPNELRLDSGVGVSSGPSVARSEHGRRAGRRSAEAAPDTRWWLSGRRGGERMLRPDAALPEGIGVRAALFGQLLDGDVEDAGEED